MQKQNGGMQRHLSRTCREHLLSEWWETWLLGRSGGVWLSSCISYNAQITLQCKSQLCLQIGMLVMPIGNLGVWSLWDALLYRLGFHYSLFWNIRVHIMFICFNSSLNELIRYFSYTIKTLDQWHKCYLCEFIGNFNHFSC